jgi:hypothetical protein
MQFKNHFIYKLGKNDPLRLIFPDGKLPNGFINKGRCAIGGTTMEIENETRCSIITVPNISILKSKKSQHREIDIVYGDISWEEVYGYLLESKQGQKIMTTPEGVAKIMWAAEQLGRKQELYDNWYFMLDEAHTFCTEYYRDDILIPFDHFFEFKNKCIITATPYFFTDPRMAELDYHEVRIKEKLGKVLLVDSASVTATLQSLIRRANELPGNIHIFYNSVTEIAKAVRRAQLEKCSIYCADDRSRKNLTTLDELVVFFKEQPDESNFEKINFYTAKYFEGWDMYDKNATLVVVTDVKKEHTKIGIGDKALQAFGRLRGKKGTLLPAEPHLLIHITNHLYNKTMKQHNEIVLDYTNQSIKNIDRHNTDITNKEIKDLIVDSRVKRVCTFDKTTQEARLHHFKLDQFINQVSTSEPYNHIGFLKQTWEKKFEVVPQFSDARNETKTEVRRKSANKQFEEDYNLLLNDKKAKEAGKIMFTLGLDNEARIKKSNPIAYQAFKILDESLVVSLKHNCKKIESQLIIKQNELAEVKLLRLLNLHFKVGTSYANSYIENKLQGFYKELEFKTKAGKIKTAEPAHLGYKGRFDLHPVKIKNNNGALENGYQIIRKQFDIILAA